MMLLVALYYVCATRVLGYQEQLQSQSVRTVFLKFETEFHKNYPASEVKARYLRFVERYRASIRHNRAHHPHYYTEINKFSDMDDRELGAYLGLGNMTELYSTLQTADLGVNDPTSLIPDQIDHVADGFVTPVKNQLTCGGCWSFAAVGSFESAYARATGYLKSFSEQEALDCTYPDTRDGCHGGWYYKTYEYLQKHQRLASYNDLPYLAKDRTCNITHFPPSAIKNLQVTGYKRVRSGDSSVQTALSKHVLAVAIFASTMFPYRSGIFDSCPQYSSTPNHALLLTGYTPLAWTLKNSWGSDWGEDGYIRVSRAALQDSCRITRYAYYPTVQYVDRGEQDQDDIYQEPEAVNVAQGGATSQSSTSWLGDSYRAVDGGKDTNYYSGSCSRTKIDYMNEWSVRLNKTQTVQKVVVTLRSDCATCTADIDGVTVHVGNQGNYWDKQCGPALDSALHHNYTLTANCNLTGNYVSLDYFNLKERKSLTLCEVEVYADDASADCPTGGHVKCSDGLCKPPSFC